MVNGDIVNKVVNIHNCPTWLQARKESMYIFNKSAVKIANEINRERENKVSPQTIRRALKDARVFAKKRVKKPALTVVHKRNRLRWANTHREWTIDDWKRVIWSDESKINRISSDGIIYNWTRQPNVLTDNNVQATVKYGGGNVMIWGSMTWAGVGKLAKIEGRMDSTQYISILDSCLLPTMDAASLLPGFPARDQLIFQQDNDPKHKSKQTAGWFAAQKISPMPWPSQSPDLNPIEHLWSHLKRQLGAYPTPPKGVHELWDRVQREWAKITPEVCQALIESMPRRIEAVIKVRGGNTKY